jgi:hypothetical protein
VLVAVEHCYTPVSRKTSFRGRGPPPCGHAWTDP